MTNKQKQCLLFFLGYYEGDIDGKFGQVSKDATSRFQDDYGLDPDGVFGPLTEEKARQAVAGTAQKVEKVNFWDGVKHFKRSEFSCNCGGKYCNGFPVEPDKDLVDLLERIRDHFGAPVTVTSGVRCKKHNTNVGGASASQHMKGTAADIKVKGVSVKNVVAYAETLLPGTGGIGTYSGFTHVDVRSKKSRWKG